jgi:hypothetical protein
VVTGDDVIGRTEQESGSRCHITRIDFQWRGGMVGCAGGWHRQ